MKRDRLGFTLMMVGLLGTLFVPAMAHASLLEDVVRQPAAPAPDLSTLVPPMRQPIPVPLLEDSPFPRGEPDPSPSLDTQFPFELPEGAYKRFLQGNTTDPGRYITFIEEHLRELGYDTDPSQIYGFDGNSSFMLPHNVGDFTGDGVDDFAMDTYCMDGRACREFHANPPYNLLENPTCEVRRPHKIFGTNGSNGTLTWEFDLNRLYTQNPVLNLSTKQGLFTNAFGACRFQFVMGDFPTDDGHRALLVYRVAALRGVGAGMCILPALWCIKAVGAGGILLIEHQFLAVDAFGKELWNVTVEGRIYGAIAAYDCMSIGDVCYTRAENLTVLPILQVPASLGFGIPILPLDTEPALFVRGSGFEDTWITPYSRSSQPIEWAGRLDLDKGTWLWKEETIRGEFDAERSAWILMPSPLFDPGSTFLTTTFAERFYWDTNQCCFDLTGDGVPDLVYTTFEWNTHPWSDPGPPYDFNARVLLFDGATGRRVYDVVVQKDTEYPVLLWYKDAVGDVDGDGVADLLLYQGRFERDVVLNLSMRRGLDGQELWHRESPRVPWIFVMGDADGAGGNDLMLFEVYPRSTMWDLTNITHNPFIAYNGKTGETLWQTTTFTSILDLIFLYQVYGQNGIPDLDGDGVGDFPTDDPVQLADLTMVHRFTFRSGADASAIRRHIGIGTFAYPSLASDLNGDGVGELCIMNGDVVDFWITCYDAESGDALWSRRILSLRMSNYLFMVPRLRFHPIYTEGEARVDMLMNLQVASAAEGTGLANVLTPQLTAIQADNANTTWAIPEYWAANQSSMVWGLPPVIGVYLAKFEPPPEPTRVEKALSFGATALPTASPFLLSFGAGALLQSRRRWK